MCERKFVAGPILFQVVPARSSSFLILECTIFLMCMSVSFQCFDKFFHRLIQIPEGVEGQ